VTDKKQLTLAFVSSAFNEAENLEELHRRCRAAHAELEKEFSDRIELDFRFVVADNGSTDSSLDVLEELSTRDRAVIALANRKNYGAEVSGVNALKQVLNCDLIVLLCSDLQDPPELSTTMGQMLLEQSEFDAVLALKKRSAGNPLMRLAKRTYYILLGYSSRRGIAPNGFHGFGCYRCEVIKDAINQWEQADFSMRQCLINACQSPAFFDYTQANRLRGTSSYRGWGYWPAALQDVLMGDAAGSRLALFIGGIGLLLALLVGLFLAINYLSGNSGYSRGAPTVMGLVLISFTLQMLMFSVLSRQIESLRKGGFRPKVQFCFVAPRNSNRAQG
jgi:glycosyltransferase involved in cell wall biosynthesis